MKIYLDVPFEEKGQAKALGAKWDAKKEKWYAPNGESALISRWPDTHDQPLVELKGEDRSYGGNSLFVDLIPTSCWFTNVRYCLDSNSWRRLRKLVYARANFQCECCGVEAKGNLDAHERWHFDLPNKVQKLVRIIALCKPCHEVTHFGFAMSRSRSEHALEHLMKVSGINRKAAKEHIEEANRLWEYRSQFEWDLNIDIIENSGIKLSRKILKNQRKQIAEDVLHKRRQASKLAEEREENVREGQLDEKVEWIQASKNAQIPTQPFQVNQTDVKVQNILIYKIKLVKEYRFLWLLLPILLFVAFQAWMSPFESKREIKKQVNQTHAQRLKKTSQGMQGSSKKKHKLNKKIDPELKEMVDFINNGKIVEL